MTASSRKRKPFNFAILRRWFKRKTKIYKHLKLNHL